MNQFKRCVGLSASEYISQYRINYSCKKIADTPENIAEALRKNLCKFKNCDKSDILERLKNNRSNFFTVYNGYCNLSRFFGYQPAGMERSGMESG